MAKNRNPYNYSEKDIADNASRMYESMSEYSSALLRLPFREFSAFAAELGHDNPRKMTEAIALARILRSMGDSEQFDELTEVTSKINGVEEKHASAHTALVMAIAVIWNDDLHQYGEFREVKHDNSNEA